MVSLLLEVIPLYLPLRESDPEFAEVPVPCARKQSISPKVNQESGPQPAAYRPLKSARSSSPRKGGPERYLSVDALRTVASAVIAVPGSLRVSPRAGAGGPRPPLASWPEQIHSSGALEVAASDPPRLERAAAGVKGEGEETALPSSAPPPPKGGGERTVPTPFQAWAVKGSLVERTFPLNVSLVGEITPYRDLCKLL